MHEEIDNQKRGRGRPAKIEVRSDVVNQLKSALKGLDIHEAEKLVIAYEPVWAIGSGNAATGAYANEVIARLREAIAEKYNKTMAERVKILYGGSVDDENIKEFIYQPEIDGVLVGGASLNAKRFIKICREAAGG